MVHSSSSRFSCVAKKTKKRWVEESRKDKQHECLWASGPTRTMHEREHWWDDNREGKHNFSSLTSQTSRRREFNESPSQDLNGKFIDKFATHCPSPSPYPITTQFKWKWLAVLKTFQEPLWWARNRSSCSSFRNSPGCAPCDERRRTSTVRGARRASLLTWENWTLFWLALEPSSFVSCWRSVGSRKVLGGCNLDRYNPFWKQ